jgi:hypothetical protein
MTIGTAVNAAASGRLPDEPCARSTIWPMEYPDGPTSLGMM